MADKSSSNPTTTSDWDVILNADPQRALHGAWLKEVYARRPVAMAWEDASREELLALDRSTVARVVDIWLMYGGVQLVPYWDAVLPRMAIRLDFDRGAGLHGLLALELATALSSPFGVVQCTACGFPYAPEKRRPPVDRRSYCPGCSAGASLAAKRAWWRRNRSAAPSPKSRDREGVRQ
jgi:hypothetical protein